MKDKKPNKTYIGGQAVLEGVMMRGKRGIATAVRDSEGVIRLEAERIDKKKSENKFLKLPIVRGVVNFFNSLVTGTKILMRSAEVYGEEDSEPTKFEKWLSKTFKVDIMSVVMTIGVVLGLALSVFLFVMCPQWLTNLLSGLFSIDKTGIWYNLIEGLIRICIFVLYIVLTSLLKDIKRTYMYHGAEHKTITCYERGLELTVENVRTCKRVHDRCGTTFLFFVMIVSILVFSLANSVIKATGIFRMLLKICFLPLVAGLSYELLKLLAKTDSPLVYPLKAPGLLLQRITTREPDDEMIEVAITAFNKALKMDEDENEQECKFVCAEKVNKITERIIEDFEKHGIDRSDAEWLVSVVSGLKRAELNSEKLLPCSQVEKIEKYAEMRKGGRPLWYIIGNCNFYGYEFKVDERVLIPRPETEELVENALKIINENDRVLDLCTGSGAIGITVKLKKGCEVVCSDVSNDALILARENAEKLNAEISFTKSDMFENIDGKFSVIITNPPYIRSGDIQNLQGEVKNYEPLLALDGGEDGLHFYRIIAERSPEYLHKGGVIFMEIGFDQADSVKQLFEKQFSVEIIKDISGIERIIKAVLL